MIRKLVTSTNINWPNIDDETSEKILKCIETNLNTFPALKRAKTLPKKAREKLKKDKQQQNQPDATNNNGDNDETKQLKMQFLFGINTITRYLEKNSNENRLLCVLVCKSCKPLRILTQHLYIMCVKMGIKAGCVCNLSEKLSNLLNLNRISAFAIVNNTESSISKYESLNKIIDNFRHVLLPLLPDLVEPFAEIKSESIEEIDVDKDHDQGQGVKCKKFKSLDEIFVKKSVCGDTKTKSFDFISLSDSNIDENVDKKSTFVDLNSKNFIFSTDNNLITNQNEDMIEINANPDSANRYFIGGSNTVEFKQFSITIKERNEEKQKQRQLFHKTKLDKKKNSNKQKPKK